MLLLSCKHLNMKHPVRYLEIFCGNIHFSLLMIAILEEIFLAACKVCDFQVKLQSILTPSNMYSLVNSITSSTFSDFCLVIFSSFWGAHLHSGFMTINLLVLTNKAYRPDAHLLYIVMHYNGNII